jgi:hypothetical protein
MWSAAAADPEILRLENLDTDLRPPPPACRKSAVLLKQPDQNRRKERKPVIAGQCFMIWVPGLQISRAVHPDHEKHAEP